MKFIRLTPRPESLATMTDEQRAEIEARARDMTAAINSLVESGLADVEAEDVSQ